MKNKETLKEFQERVYKNKDAGKVFEIPEHLVKDVAKFGMFDTPKKKPLFINLTHTDDWIRQVLEICRGNPKQYRNHEFIWDKKSTYHMCRYCFLHIPHIIFENWDELFKQRQRNINGS